jgi:hypothetical protein
MFLFIRRNLLKYIHIGMKPIFYFYFIGTVYDERGKDLPDYPT